MDMLLIILLRQHLQSVFAFIVLSGLISVIAFPNHEVKNDKAKLFDGAVVHGADETRIASLAKELQDQNDAVTALQAAQTRKEQAVDKALVVAKVQQ